MNRQKRLLRATLGWRAAAKRVKAQRLAMCRLARRGARRRVVSTLRTMERVAAKRRALGHLVATREQKVAAKAVDALRATAERERLVEIGANRCAALEIRTRTRAARGTLSAWRSASRGRVRARTTLQRVVVCARRNALALCWSAWGRNVATSSAAARRDVRRARFATKRTLAVLRAHAARWVAAVAHAKHERAVAGKAVRFWLRRSARSAFAAWAALAARSVATRRAVRTLVLRRCARGVRRGFRALAAHASRAARITAVVERLQRVATQRALQCSLRAWVERSDANAMARKHDRLLAHVRARWAGASTRDVLREWRALAAAQVRARAMSDAVLRRAVLRAVRRKLAPSWAAWRASTTNGRVKEASGSTRAAALLAQIVEEKFRSRRRLSLQRQHAFAQWSTFTMARSMARRTLTQLGKRTASRALGRALTTWRLAIHHHFTLAALELTRRIHVESLCVEIKRNRNRAMLRKWRRVVTRCVATRRATRRAMTRWARRCTARALFSWRDGVEAIRGEKRALRVVVHRHFRKGAREAWTRLSLHSQRAAHAVAVVQRLQRSASERALGAALRGWSAKVNARTSARFAARKHQQLLAHVRARWVGASARDALRSWRSVVVLARSERELTSNIVGRVLRRVLHRTLAEGWRGWCLAATRARNAETETLARAAKVRSMARCAFVNQTRVAFESWRCAAVHRGAARQVLRRVGARARCRSLARASSAWRLAVHHHFTLDTLEITRRIHVDALTREVSRGRKRHTLHVWQNCVAASVRSRRSGARAAGVWMRRSARGAFRAWRNGASLAKKQRVVVARMMRRGVGIDAWLTRGLFHAWRDATASRARVRATLFSLNNRLRRKTLLCAWRALLLRGVAAESELTRSSIATALGVALRARLRRHALREKLAMWCDVVRAKMCHERRLQRALAAWTLARARRALERWRLVAEERARARAMMSRTICRATSARLASGWAQWRAVDAHNVHIFTVMKCALLRAKNARLGAALCQWRAADAEARARTKQVQRQSGAVQRAFAQQMRGIRFTSFGRWAKLTRERLFRRKIARRVMTRRSHRTQRKALLFWRHATHREWTLATLEAVSSIHVHVRGEHAVLRRKRIVLSTHLQTWSLNVKRNQRARAVLAKISKRIHWNTARGCFGGWRVTVERAQQQRARFALVLGRERKQRVRDAWVLLTAHREATRRTERVGTVVRRWGLRNDSRLVLSGLRAWISIVASRLRMKRIGARVLRRWAKAQMHQIFERWCSGVCEQIRVRRIVKRMQCRVQHALLAAGWNSLRLAIAHTISAEERNAEIRRIMRRVQCRAQHARLAAGWNSLRLAIAHTMVAQVVQSAEERNAEIHALRERRKAEVMRRVTQRWTHTLASTAFDAWDDFVATRQRSRHLVKRVLARLSHASRARGWLAWRGFVERAGEAERSALRRARLVRRVVQRWNEAALGKNFANWDDFAQASIRTRVSQQQRLLRVVAKMKKYTLLRGWRAWVSDVVSTQRVVAQMQQSALAASSRKEKRLGMILQQQHNEARKQGEALRARLVGKALAQMRSTSVQQALWEWAEVVATRKRQRYHAVKAAAFWTKSLAASTRLSFLRWKELAVAAKHGRDTERARVSARFSARWFVLRSILGKQHRRTLRCKWLALTQRIERAVAVKHRALRVQRFSALFITRLQKRSLWQSFTGWRTTASAQAQSRRVLMQSTVKLLKRKRSAVLFQGWDRLVRWSRNAGSTIKRDEARAELMHRVLRRFELRAGLRLATVGWGEWTSYVAKKLKHRAILRRTVRSWKSAALRAVVANWWRAAHAQRETRAMVARLVRRIQHRDTYAALRQWATVAAEAAREESQTRAMITRLIRKMQHRSTSSAFVQWSTASAEALATEREMKEVMGQVSSALLAQQNASEAEHHSRLLGRIIERGSTRMLRRSLQQWRAVRLEWIEAIHNAQRKALRYQLRACVRAWRGATELSRRNRAQVQRLIARLQQRLHRTLRDHFAAWIEGACSQQKLRLMLRRNLTRAVQRSKQRSVHSHFKHWHACVESHHKVYTRVRQLLAARDVDALTRSFRRWCSESARRVHARNALRFLRIATRNAARSTLRRWFFFLRQRVADDKAALTTATALRAAREAALLEGTTASEAAAAMETARTVAALQAENERERCAMTEAYNAAAAAHATQLEEHEAALALMRRDAAERSAEIVAVQDVMESDLTTRTAQRAEWMRRVALQMQSGSAAAQTRALFAAWRGVAVELMATRAATRRVFNAMLHRALRCGWLSWRFVVREAQSQDELDRLAEAAAEANDAHVRSAKSAYERAAQLFRLRSTSRMLSCALSEWSRTVAARRRRIVMLERVAARWSTAILATRFGAWRAAHRARVANRDRTRKLMARVIARGTRRLLFGGWNVWAAATERARSAAVAAARREVILRRVSTRWRHAVAGTRFATWEEWTRQQVWSRTVITRVLSRMTLRTLGLGWTSWRARVISAKEEAIAKERRKKKLRRVAQRWIHAKLAARFATWREMQSQRTRTRRVVKRILARALQRSLCAGWRTWLMLVEDARVADFEAARKKKTIRLVSERWSLAIVAVRFSAWEEWAQRRLRSRVLVSRALSRGVHKKLSLGWNAWTTAVECAHREDIAAVQRTMKLRRVTARWHFATTTVRFAQWRAFTVETVQSRRTMKLVLSHSLQRSLVAGWRAWHVLVVEARDNAKEEARREVILRRVSTRWRHAVAGTRFATWEEWTRQQVWSRTVITRVLSRMTLRTLGLGWTSWRARVISAREEATARISARQLISRFILRGLRKCELQAWNAWRVAVEQERATDLKEARNVQIVRRAMHRILHQCAGRAFAAWRHWIEIRVRRRRAVAQLVRRVLRQHLSLGWSTWRSALVESSAAHGDNRLRFQQRLVLRLWSARCEAIAGVHLRSVQRSFLRWR